MGRYLVQRVLLMLPTLFLISVVTFVIIQLPPGDYLETMISDLEASGERADLAKVEFLRQEFGLDQPLWKQYWFWVTGLVRGDMGYSFEYDRPVSDIIGERLLLTFVVSFGSIIFTWLVAFPIGVYSATHQYSWGDHGLTFLGFLGLATPNFLLALVLMFISFTYFGTSVGGLFSPDMQNAPWSWARVWDMLQHLWIPVIVIGTSGTAAMIRRLRANLLDELRRPYVVTARAKGLTPRRILLKYPLRIALNPFIGDIGNLLPQVISGAIIVSIVLSLPTTGPILLRALRAQDMYLAGSFLMLLATLTVIGVFLSDLALAALDPRIRQGGGQTR
jgi:peptide/nickel transport system permease protein